MSQSGADEPIIGVMHTSLPVVARRTGGVSGPGNRRTGTSRHPARPGICLQSDEVQLAARGRHSWPRTSYPGYQIAPWSGEE